jgi:hypothetical protein
MIKSDRNIARKSDNDAQIMSPRFESQTRAGY